MQSRIMYVERGGGLETVDARIGRVTFSKTGKTLKYNGYEYRSLKGYGYKSNYYNIDNGEECWISGPRKDGGDSLYPLTVVIDDDVREEYWLEIRNEPQNVHMTSFRSAGKYSKRRPRPELNVSGSSRVGSNRGGDKARL